MKNVKHILAVIKHFNKLASGEIKPVSAVAGLCAEYFNRDVFDVETSHRLELRTYFKTWKHFSGQMSFPIPKTSKRFVDSCDQFTNTKNLWKGKQGKLRRHLCRHIVRKLEKELIQYISTFKLNWGTLHNHNRHPTCVFLGVYDSHDLYVCLGKTQTFVGRYADDGPDYVSGMDTDHPILNEARNRAYALQIL